MTGKEDEDEDDLDITASTSDIIAEQKAAAAAAAIPKGKTKSQLIKSKKDNWSDSHKQSVVTTDFTCIYRTAVDLGIALPCVSRIWTSLT